MSCLLLFSPTKRIFFLAWPWCNITKCSWSEHLPWLKFHSLILCQCSIRVSLPQWHWLTHWLTHRPYLQHQECSLNQTDSRQPRSKQWMGSFQPWCCIQKSIMSQPDTIIMAENVRLGICLDGELVQRLCTDFCETLWRGECSSAYCSGTVSLCVSWCLAFFPTSALIVLGLKLMILSFPLPFLLLLLRFAQCSFFPIPPFFIFTFLSLCLRCTVRSRGRKEGHGAAIYLYT